MTRKLKILGLKISRNLLRIFHNFCYVDNKDNSTYNIEYLSVSGSSCFFGYHDLDPCFDNGDKILSHVYKGKSSNSEAIDSLIDVGYFQRIEGRWLFQKIGETSAWCWQQGARLQILGNSGDVPIALYNIRTSENSFGAVAISLNDGTIHDKWEVPFNAVSRSGQYGGVLNFGLLGLKRPGYGYSVNKVDELPYIRVLCLSTKEVVYEEVFKSDVEYINHMSFSPDDKWLIYFKFFKSASQERVRSLCVIDLENCVQFDELSNVNFSHFAWLDKNTLVMSVSRKLGWIALKYNIPKRSRKKISILPGDFHPFYISSSNEIIYDSYPVKGKRYLYKSTASFNRKKLICAINDISSLKNDCRVDLHPRYMESMGAINVDIGNEDDYREMAIIRTT